MRIMIKGGVWKNTEVSGCCGQHVPACLCSSTHCKTAYCNPSSFCLMNILWVFSTSVPSRQQAFAT